MQREKKVRGTGLLDDQSRFVSCIHLVPLLYLYTTLSNKLAFSYFIPEPLSSPCASSDAPVLGPNNQRYG